MKWMVFFMSFIVVIFVCLFALFGCSPTNIRIFDNSVKGEKIVLDDNVGSEEIAEFVKDAIVGIGGVSSSGTSVGSGVCVTDSGYILTNSHVINNAKSIVLYLADGSTATAKIIYNNPVSDLAIIKSDRTIPFLAIGQSDELNVGEDVLAVGTPLSLSLTHTFTKGIVSALNRTLKTDSSSGEGYMQNLIQHDASLNPGNSGGPLLNSKGEVVGINTLKITSGEGIGFAIPSKSFLSLVESYANNINYALPYLGVFGIDSEIINYRNQEDYSSGFFIIDIADNSPLKEKNIPTGSVITKFNGVPIFNVLDLQYELYKHSSKDSVYIQYEYRGNLHTVKTQLG